MLVSIFSILTVFSIFSTLPAYQMPQICEICTCSVVADLILTLFLATEVLQTSSTLFTCRLACALAFYFPFECVFSSTGFKPCNFTASKQFFFSTLIGSLQWNHFCSQHCINRKSLALHCQFELLSKPTCPLEFKLLTPHCSIQISELKLFSRTQRAKQLKGITEK